MIKIIKLYSGNSARVIIVIIIKSKRIMANGVCEKSFKRIKTQINHHLH
jgi:hypothetical protein